jgi:hypothetical protein
VEKIINACTLDWENEQPNGGFFKVAYKHMQTLYTVRNLIFVGNPMGTFANTLQNVLEEKWKRQGKKWSSATQKYGLINKVP